MKKRKWLKIVDKQNFEYNLGLILINSEIPLEKEQMLQICYIINGTLGRISNIYLKNAARDIYYLLGNVSIIDIKVKKNKIFVKIIK